MPFMTETTGSNTAATEGWDGHNVIAVSFEDDGNACKALTSLTELDSQHRVGPSEWAPPTAAKDPRGRP